MAMHWTAKREAVWDRVLDNLRKREGGPRLVEIGLFCTAGRARTARDNYRVLDIQRYQGRNPWFISAAEHQQLSALIASRRSLTELIAIAHELGAAIVAIYRQHIADGISEKGAMPPLKQSTLRRKEKSGRAGEPILVDTGELISSLTYGVRDRSNG